MPRTNVKWQFVEPVGNWQALPSNREGEVMGLKETASSFRGELGAIYLQGLNDLHSAIVPAFPESQHGVDQLGTPLNPTSQMVTRDIEPTAAAVEAPTQDAASYSRESDRGYEAMLDQAASVHKEQEMEMEL